MLLQHYSNKILTALFGGLFVFGGIYTFGDGLLFDRIFIGILVFTAVICRKNVNVIGGIAVIGIQRILEEGGWYLLDIANGDNLRIGSYVLACIAWYKFKYDKLSRLLVVCMTLVIASEVYWYVAEIPKPFVHWFIFLMSLSLLARYMIFVRVSYTDDFFPGKASSINLDWHIYKIYALGALANFFMIVEYLVRNVLGFKKILVVYETYPFVMQAIATYAIWVIFNESYKLLLPKILKA